MSGRGGRGSRGISGTSLLNHALQQLDGFVQKIHGAAQRDLELLHRLRPASFPPEKLKPAMLFIEDGLFCIEHKTISRAHVPTSDGRGSHRIRPWRRFASPAQTLDRCMRDLD